MTLADEQSGLLAGIRVLDLTMFLAGPYSTRLIADLGADVIKIEPTGGEFIRNTPPVVDGNSRYFTQLNCGKKSVVLDLKSEQGHQDFMGLVANADVVVENFRPGVMKRLGLDYDILKATKDDIIFCSISGYGQVGPDAGRPAFAPIIHAASGVDMAQFDNLKGAIDKPARNRNATADVLAGTHAFGAIAAALFRRERTGRGQRIDIALIDCIHNMLAAELQVAQVPDAGGAIVFTPIRAVDGFVMAAPVSQANFEALCKAIERPDFITDPRFEEPKTRISNFDVLMAEAELWSIDRSAEETEQTILDAGCPATRYYTVLESMQNPATTARGAVIETSDAGGDFIIPNSPFKVSNDPAERQTRLPKLGQDTDEVLDSLR
jgi:crotonobetainyl-CoA:carnitine CoA-transferase CaiB-like acyl-CoA transferase